MICSGTKPFSGACKTRTQSIGTVFVNNVWIYCAAIVICEEKNVKSIEVVIFKPHSAMMNIKILTFPVDDISQQRFTKMTPCYFS